MVPYLEPGITSTPGTPVVRMTCPGWGVFPGNSSAIVSDGSRFRTAVGPQNPWLRLDCGSRSARRTRSPIFENAPERWKVQLDLPHPPFWFSSVIVSMSVPSLGTGATSHLSVGTFPGNNSARNAPLPSPGESPIASVRQQGGGPRRARWRWRGVTAAPSRRLPCGQRGPLS